MISLRKALLNLILAHATCALMQGNGEPFRKQPFRARRALNPIASSSSSSRESLEPRKTDLRFGQIASTPFVLFDAISKGSLKREEVKTNDIIIAGNEIPQFNLYRYQSYVLTRVYYQGMDAKENKVVRLDVDELDAEVPEIAAEIGGKWQKYLSLYSPNYHKASGPVVVTEEEMRIVSLKEEILSSTVLAMPGLFWLWLAYKFWLYGQ